MFVFIAINLDIIQMICVRSLLVTQKKNPIKETLFQEALNYRYPFVDVVDVSTSV